MLLLVLHAVFYTKYSSQVFVTLKCLEWGSQWRNRTKFLKTSNLQKTIINVIFQRIMPLFFENPRQEVSQIVHAISFSIEWMELEWRSFVLPWIHVFSIVLRLIQVNISHVKAVYIRLIAFSKTNSVLRNSKNGIFPYLRIDIELK